MNSSKTETVLLEKILKTLAAGGASDRLVLEFKNFPTQKIADFISEVDESIYPLKEWCEALVAFSNWEKSEGKSLGLSGKIEYLCCCVQGSTNDGKLLSLTAIWENYVDAYGVQSN